MAIKHKTRVKETASNKPNASTAFNLPGSAATGFRTFATAYANADQLPYHATNGTDWESGVGTFTTGSPNTIVRTTILESSNADAAVDFSAGADIELFVEWPSSAGFDADEVKLSYISGLTITCNSATQIAVSDGSAYVDVAKKVIKTTSTQTIDPTLSASSWHYVYLKGDGTIDVSTTAPSSPYIGSARSKNSTGNEFRFLGAFRTNASSQILKFYQRGNHYLYPLAIDSAIYRLLSNGKATTSTLVSLASVVPPMSQYVSVKVSNTDATQNLSVGDGDTTQTGSVGYFSVAGNLRVNLLLPLNATQQMAYVFSAAPSGGAFVDVLGYVMER